MIRIADLLDRDFSRPIEEIIKVNNADEESVYTELTEYIATDRIKIEYQDLFKAMADAPKSPNEGVGVWISGFFGSGKSSFAKNLGYVLANRSVLDSSASALFLKQVDSKRISEYVDFLNRSVPYEVFMFDVQVDLSVQTNAEQIAEVMYRVLLRSLDYAEDYDISELEIELESEKRLDQFQSLCQQEYQDDWRKMAALFQGLVPLQIGGQFSARQADCLIRRKHFKGAHQGPRRRETAAVQFVNHPENAMNFDVIFCGNGAECFVTREKDGTWVAFGDGKSKAVVYG